MSDKNLFVIGSGRLAHRLYKIFNKSNVGVVHIKSEEFKEIEETTVQESSMSYARDLLINKGIMDASTVCIVDGEDAINIYLLMAVLSVHQTVPIYTTFFNENLVFRLAANHPNVKIFNPANIVSKLFVEAVPKSMLKSEEAETLSTYRDSPRDSLIFWLVSGFIFLMISGACFFSFTEETDWQKSFYLVVTLITGNFNDADLTNNNQPIMLTGLMLATFAYTIMLLSFIFDYIVKRRTDILTLGRRRYHKRGHVIVCGLGRVGYAIVQDLIIKKESIIVIESSPDNKYLPAVRSYKIPVLIGDATLPHYLIDAGIGRAKALISAIDSDLVDLEIGLNARSENGSIRLLLRIFDQSTAEEMKRRLDINYVFSKSYTTAKVIYDCIYPALYMPKILAKSKR